MIKVGSDVRADAVSLCLLVGSNLARARVIWGSVFEQF